MKTIMGKVDSYNRGEKINNITIFDIDNNPFNIKLTNEQLNDILIGKAYIFTYETTSNEVRDTYTLVSAVNIEEALEKDELGLALKAFYDYAPINPVELRKGILGYLEEIKNPNIKLITNELFKMYEKDFFVHPAATRFHHAYIGGLAFHTLQMLNASRGFLNIYPYLNKDLLFAGILIHDMAKITEMSGPGGQYTKEGQLLGHLVIISNEISKIAEKHGIAGSEEALLLKHIGVSHHGIAQFGAAKKPQTGEALLIWYLDTIDSKLQTLGEELELTEKGDFTSSVAVLDKMRFYKPNLNEE